MDRITKVRKLPAWAGSLLAAALVAATLGLRFAMGFYLGDQPLLILFVIPITLSAYLGGFGAGITATVLSAIVSDYYLLPPVGFGIGKVINKFQWGALWVIGLLISLLSEGLHRSRRRLAAGHDLLTATLGRSAQAAEELRRLNRMLKALSSSNHAMVWAQRESDYLDQVCRIVVEDCGHSMVWIGLAEDDPGKSVRVVAYSGFDEGYLQALRLTWADSERGRGPTGTAIRTGTTVICRDIANDPRLAPWRADATRRGYASSIAVPITIGERTIGALTIYAGRIDAFSDDEVRLLTDLAGDLAHGIQALRLRIAHDQAKEAAEAANRSKDAFLAALSHELRTPLTPVMAAAGAMRRDQRLPEDAREDAAMIQRNISLEVALIGDLLDVTRIAAGKLTLKKSRVDAGQVMRDAARICAGDLDGKELILAIDAPDGPYLVEADAARLHQVFWNLIKNAIKFTDRRGRISIRLQRTAGADGPGICITITDTGVGIDPEVLPKLFQPFEQGDESTTRVFGGLGLGLAISKSIVKMHGGTIEAHSEGRGAGAVFTVCLPAIRIAETETAGAVPASPRRPEPRLESRPLRILLVEDHADTARIMVRLLASEGHSVTRADSVAAALLASEREPFDVLVSDLGLPDGSGHDLLRQVTARGRSLKAIALSGYGSPDDVRQSMEAGFSEHLTKPVDFDALHRALIRLASEISVG